MSNVLTVEIATIKEVCNRYPQFYIHGVNSTLSINGLEYVQDINTPFYNLLGQQSYYYMSMERYLSSLDMDMSLFLSKLLDVCKEMPTVIPPFHVTNEYKKYVEQVGNPYTEYYVDLILDDFTTHVNRKNRYKIKDCLKKNIHTNLQELSYDTMLEHKEELIQLVTSRFDDVSKYDTYATIKSKNQPYAVYQVIYFITLMKNNPMCRAFGLFDNNKLVAVVGIIDFTLDDNTYSYFYLNVNNPNYSGSIQALLARIIQANTLTSTRLYLGATSFFLNEDDRCYDYKKCLATSTDTVFALAFNDSGLNKYYDCHEQAWFQSIRDDEGNIVDKVEIVLET